jgi:nuclear pore complex protein Nup188
VAQEWQSRPARQMLSGLTEEEALSVQDAAGIANLGASTFAPNSSILTSPFAARASQFDTQDQRRLRIIDTYYSTCASIIRISQLLVSGGALEQLRTQTAYDKHYHNLRAGWIEELGQTLTTAQNNGASALDECLRAVQKRCEALAGGLTWSVAESITEHTWEKCVVAHTTELLHLLHLSLAHADLVTKGFVPAATLEDWLKFFMQNSFFADFPTVSSAQH